MRLKKNYDSCYESQTEEIEDEFIAVRKKKLDRDESLKYVTKKTITTPHQIVPQLVKLENRFKGTLFLYHLDPAIGVPCIWLLESSEHGDVAGLSGSIKNRTNSLNLEMNGSYESLEKGALEDIKKTYEDELSEELDIQLPIDYFEKHSTQISGIPWGGEGKLSRDRTWRRQLKYVPITVVLDMTEYLLNNFSIGDTIEKCFKEFAATRCIHHYLYAGDGEVSGVRSYPIDDLPSNVWNKHRAIMEKTTSEGILPTFRDFLGTPRFALKHEKEHEDAFDPSYSAKVFNRNFRLLREDPTEEHAIFFRDIYPTLAEGAETPDDVLQNIFVRRRYAIRKKELERARKSAARPVVAI